MDDQKQDNTFMPEQDGSIPARNRFDSIAPTSRKSPSMAQSPNM